ncbi:MAG: hypothetical protein FWE31_03525 [Firmicutes bacterium]|nr:hypothetical protein [Bacillota bacterium]
MKKGIITSFIILIVGIVALSVATISPKEQRIRAYALSGAGSIIDPFRIYTVADLEMMRPTTGPWAPNVSGRHYRLMNDLDMGGSNWVPLPTIGIDNSFDGAGHTIYNMTVNVANNGGLFARVVGGIIHDLSFANASISIDTFNAGVVTGQASNNSRFENIQICSNSVVQRISTGASGNSAGGVVGLVDAGHAIFDGIQTGASVTGGHSLGGMVGRVTGTANVTVMNSTNTGTITALAPGAGFGRSGGIVGFAEGNSNITIDWVVNRGAVNSVHGNSAGILGAAWNAVANINNAINDASVTVGAGNQAAIATLNVGMLVVRNVWFNSTLAPSLNISNVAIPLPYSGGMTSAQLRTQTAMEAINLNGGEEKFVIWGGQVYLQQFVPMVTYTFGTIIVRLPEGHNYVLVPTENLPTKVGYNLTGWLLAGTPITVDEEGRFHGVTGFSDMHFEPDFQLKTFELYLSDSPIPSTDITLGSGTIQLGQAGVTISADPLAWAAHFIWLVQHANMASYTTLGDTVSVDLSALFDEAFITAHAQGDRIVIRIASTLTSSTILTQGNGGTIGFRIDGGDLITGLVGVPIILPMTPLSRITQLVAAPHDHFQFSSMHLDGSFLSAAPVFNPLVTDLRFVLSSLHGSTILVNFTPVQYSIEFEVAIRGGHIHAMTPGEMITISSAPQVYINSNANIEATAVEETEGFRFAGWRMGGLLLSSLDVSVITDIAWLNQFVANGQVTIIAEYVRTFALSARVEIGQEALGSLDIIVVDALTGRHDRVTSLSNAQIAEDSLVEIRANASRLGAFSHFANSFATHITPTIIRFNIELAQNITAIFEDREFDIIVESRQQNNQRLWNIEGFVTDPSIRVGDTVTADAELVESPNYRFVNFTIKNGEGGYVELEDTFITPQLLMANLNADDEFEIIANFIRIFIVNVSNSFDSEEMGTYRLFVDYQETDEREFVIGTTVRIEAIPHDFHYLAPVSITGINTATELSAPGEATITGGLFHRNITLHFVPRILNLATTIRAGSGEVSVNRPITEDGRILNIRAGDQIRMAVSPPSNRQVRNWSLNGANINELENVERLEDGHIIITLDIDWLTLQDVSADGSILFDTYVTYRLTTGILLAILLPAILIPLLGLIVIWYIVASNRKYKAIKAELIAENRKQVMFGGGFISDLKAGKNVGQVTDQDIKDRMKKNQ